MKKMKLSLYVLEDYPSSKEAIACIEKILESLPRNSYDFEIIDMLKNPEKTESDNILVAPTLIKRSPLPFKKLVGSFNDSARIIKELNIDGN